MVKKITLAACALVALQLLAVNDGYSQTTKKAAPAKPATSVKPTQKPPPPPAPLATPQEIEEGKVLITRLDCMVCHKVNEKSIGPAYIDVSKKYPHTDSTVSILSGKVINGGSGNWGQVPMAPHATLSKTDAEKLVKYILSLSATK
ncbi:MAG: c-type cytochrome [Niastella sp.]|nr:c-type cytochrome [Niastella sp.]